MKKFLIFAMVAMSVMVTACSDEDDDENGNATIDKSMQGYWFKLQSDNTLFTVVESNGDHVVYGIKIDESGDIHECYVNDKGKLGTYNEVVFELQTMKDGKFTGVAVDNNTYTGTYSMPSEYCYTTGVDGKLYSHEKMQLSSSVLSQIYLRDYSKFPDMKFTGNYAKLFNLDASEAYIDVVTNDSKLVGTWANDACQLVFEENGSGYCTSYKYEYATLTWSGVNGKLSYTINLGSETLESVLDAKYEFVGNGLYINEEYFVKMQ